MLCQAQTQVGDLLKAEVRQTLINDGLLLSESIKQQPSNNLWKNEKQREKVIKEYDDFWAKIQNTFTPPLCASRPLHQNLVLDGESLAQLGARVFAQGNLQADFRGSFPEYSLPPGQSLGIPAGELGNDNSFFNFTSKQMLRFTSSNELDMAVGKAVEASAKAYLKKQAESAYQISYSCGTFRNYLGFVADGIIKNETFNREDATLVRQLWDRSGRATPADSLLLSFGGVCVYTSRGTDTYDQKKLEAALQGGFRTFVLAGNTNSSLSLEKQNGLRSNEERYKVFLYTRPYFTAHPTPAQIKEVWKRTVQVRVEETDYKLLSNSIESIRLQVGPIDSVMAQSVALDEQYTLDKLQYKGLLNRPKLELIPGNGIGTYILLVKVSVNPGYVVDASSEVIKGGRFDLPLRLYYNRRAGFDTLVLFESPAAASIRYENLPAVEAADFELIDRPTDTAYYYFKGFIPVRLESDDDLLPSNNMILRLRKVQGDSPVGWDNLLKRLSFHSGEPAAGGYRFRELRVEKQYFNGQRKSLTLEVDVRVRHTRYRQGSDRIATINMTLPE